VVRILGADVGKTSVVVCCLEIAPDSLKTYLRSHQSSFQKIESTDVDTLLAMPWDALVMEPTGIHYSRIWEHHAKLAGRTVLWVSHSAIANHRKANQLPGKNDFADALTLAHWGLTHYGKPEFFLQFDDLATQLRSIFLDMRKCDRNKHGSVAQLRQRLAHEYPEVAETSQTREWLKPTPGSMWRFLAGEETQNRYHTDRSIGTGITPFSQKLAQDICYWERVKYDLEVQAQALLTRPELDRYHVALDTFAVGERFKIGFLGRVYPIEQYLKDGKPIIERVIGTNSGNLTKRRRSLAAYKLDLGLGQVEASSGGIVSWKAGGPAYSRALFFMEVENLIVKLKRNPQGLHDLYLRLKEAKMPYKKRVMKVAIRLAEEIFKKLV
jgi:hypothetical protein